MSAAQPGPIRVFFGTLWSIVNFTNHLVFNLIMLFILLAISSQIFGIKTLYPFYNTFLTISVFWTDLAYFCYILTFTQ